MNPFDKDWLKIALELYEKSKGMGVLNSLGKDGLEDLMKIVGQLNPAAINTKQLHKEEEKLAQETVPIESIKDDEDGFWKQESGPPLGQESAAKTSKGDYTPPISIHETVGSVNLHIILPGIISSDDLNILLSQEEAELYGTKSTGRVSGGVKTNEKFYRLIRLPAPVDPSRATATYRNGFLYISIPKKDRPSHFKIQVEFV